MKLAIGVPWTSPFIWTDTSDSLLNLERPRAVRNQMGALEPLEVHYFRGKGWCPARRHISLCEQALSWGADLILILGADQLYPTDLLPRLLKHWEAGCEVVAAMVPSRCYVDWQPMKPFQPMAWRIKPSGNLDLVSVNDVAGFLNNVEVIDPAAGDLQQINFIGSGVLMFHRDHLLSLKQPWFSETFNEQTYDRLASMDTGFVWRLQTETGARVWCDTTIKIKHLHPMPVDDSFQERFTDWAQPGVGDPTICNFEHPLMVKSLKQVA